MQNDLTTVEPPISVTAVSISDDNFFQSPFFSDLLLGFFPFCQKFWKFRLRNKWNASFRVEIFWSKHRLPKLCFEFIGLPVVKVVHFHRWSSFTGRSDPIETCHVKKFSFPFLLCQASNQTFSQNWMDLFNLFGDFGRFPFNQKVWFAFLAENGTAFSKIFKKRTTLRGITRFSETFCREFFFPFNFDLRISRIFGRMVHISKTQQFVEFLDTFLRNFCTTCLCFQIFKSFSWMESALCFNQRCSVFSL